MEKHGTKRKEKPPDEKDENFRKKKPQQQQQAKRCTQDKQKFKPQPTTTLRHPIEEIRRWKEEITNWTYRPAR